MRILCSQKQPWHTVLSNCYPVYQYKTRKHVLIIYESEQDNDLLCFGWNPRGSSKSSSSRNILTQKQRHENYYGNNLRLVLLCNRCADAIKNMNKPTWKSRMDQRYFWRYKKSYPVV